jgi:hypothetical protein
VRDHSASSTFNASSSSESAGRQHWQARVNDQGSTVRDETTMLGNESDTLKMDATDRWSPVLVP